MAIRGIDFDFGEHNTDTFTGDQGDTLLPRLISGKLRLPEVAEAVIIDGRKAAAPAN